MSSNAELVQYPIKNDPKNLICFRIVNIGKDRKTALVQMDSNPVSPKTEIEDTLNGKLFYETLRKFEDSHPELTNVLNDIKKPLKKRLIFP